MSNDDFPLKELISADRIGKRVVELAHRISRDYCTTSNETGKPLVLLGVMKGSFMFLSDLARALSIPVEIEFVAITSYGDELASSGSPRTVVGMSVPLEGRDVLVVEDIVDSGRTLEFLLEYLKTFRARTIATCTLLNKSEARVVSVPVDYIGFAVPPQFVVGYGLDAAGRYRELNAIHTLETRK